MSVNTILIAAVISLFVSLGTAIFFILRIRADRQFRLDKAAETLDPVVREAEELKASLAPLMEQLRVLHKTIAAGQERSASAQILYEKRIKQLEEEIQRKGF